MQHAHGEISLSSFVDLFSVSVNNQYETERGKRGTKEERHILIPYYYLKNSSL